MQRQRSILSFLRPSSENRSSGHAPADDPTGSADSAVEVRGTDTPPEKVPRPFLVSGEDDGGSSLFSSIMHKFVRPDGGEKKTDARNHGHNSTSNACFGPSKSSDLITSQHNRHENVVNKKEDQECLFGNHDDVLGPDTPGMRPLVPRFKRVQEEVPKLEAKYDSWLNPSKKFKAVHDLEASRKNDKGSLDLTSKFEWLHPSCIRDANRRRPDDPLYDKRTLYIPLEALNKMSATQKQYWRVKCQYMDVVLFFKVGKFYELYELDADIGHKELDWKITFSGVGKCRQVGISESGIDDAVRKLVARGYKVGRMEQEETAERAKARGPSSVISRKLVYVMTPSTSVDSNIGPDAVHLLAVKEGECGVDGSSISYGFAFVDCATLKFWVGSIDDDASSAALGALLMQVAPKEVIYESKGLSKEALKAIRKYSLTGNVALQLTPVMPLAGFPSPSDVVNLVQSKGYFNNSSSSWRCALDGVVQSDAAVCAVGGLIDHLARLMLEDVLKNGDIALHQVYSGCLRMDGQTLVNLEIFSNSADGGSSGTLYKYLDNCITCSGKRLLRHWICHPLKDIENINNRLNAVDNLAAQPEVMLLIAQNLRKLPDLERLLGRVKSSVRSSISLLLPMVGQKLLKNLVRHFGSLVRGIRTAIELLMILQGEQNLSLSLAKIFKLPVLVGSTGLDMYLTQFEAAIDSDFPNYQNHNVADSDAETLSALIELFVEKAAEWSAVIHAINCVDVLRSFTLAATSSIGASCRPIILPQTKATCLSQEIKGPRLKLTGLWHPFAFAESGGLPVPNDVVLGEDTDGYHPRTLLLTGPNMGGKSTLLRATCLAVILAQLGCYVPCEACILSPVDVIFTRLGATDRIMAGESTFFVECSETASVLQNATEDSLVILDELGRGTSTFDGYSIAYAVFRHLVENVNCRLLFATHYHPLTKEFGTHPRVTLQHMACAFHSKSGSDCKTDQELVFLYQLAHGACPESYGLQVASMAGIPRKVVDSASRAGRVMQKSIGESFKLSEQRMEFSTLHEEWLRTLLSEAQTGESDVNDDEDALDTFFCLWHEVKGSYPSSI